MIIKNLETNRIAGKQTLLFDPNTQKYYTVTTVSSEVVNKTFILRCDENGKPKDTNELFVLMPGNHKYVVESLTSQMITAQDFNFKGIL